MFTPWGGADSVTTLADGIVAVTTASHGGIGLDDARNAAMPAALRNDNGWYEEDVEWALVAYVFPDAFPAEQAAAAPDIVRGWFPDQWTAHTGEIVTAEQSRIVAEREFTEAHLNDLVAISAIGKTSWTNVPDGKVLVCATLAGDRTSNADRHHFYVDTDRYRAAVGFPYVIDVELDEPTDETI